MKFILTRHATTEWNLIGRIQGQTDINLSHQGKVEAENLAKELRGNDIDLIISSDLKRACQTAEIINILLRIPLRQERGLRECSFGKLEGLTRQEAVDQFGRSIEGHWDDQFLNYDFRPFGGECREDVFNRHLAVIKSLAENNVSRTVLLVGHGRGISTLLSGLGCPPDIRRGEYRLIDYPKKV